MRSHGVALGVLRQPPQILLVVEHLRVGHVIAGEDLSLRGEQLGRHPEVRGHIGRDRVMADHRAEDL
ncbi:hypothetical protein SDC9_201491 [bioreactor metagenome]|uniref:Uncharacterized protein n=1 Tax=bioreactor metagenome TaxID=1076179 RepID=A0A645IR34_9ZZZZ